MYGPGKVYLGVHYNGMIENPETVAFHRNHFWMIGDCDKVQAKCQAVGFIVKCMDMLRIYRGLV